MVDIAVRIHIGTMDIIKILGNPTYRGKEITIGIKNPHEAGGCKYRIDKDHNNATEYIISFENLSESNDYNGPTEDIMITSRYDGLINDRNSLAIVTF